MKQKNGKIELMRFVFTLCVLIYHINLDLWDADKYFLGGRYSLFRHGALSVEFFFLVSGFLMAKSIHARLSSGQPQAISQQALADETLHFLWRKVKGILPYHLPFCAIIAVIFWLSDPASMPESLLLKLPSLFFLQRTGLTSSGSLLGVEWYLSSMLLAMALLYPLCRRYYPMITHVIAPVGGILLIGYFFHTTGRLTNAHIWSGITYGSNLRAVAEIGFGASCFEVCRVMRQKTFSPLQRLLLTLAEGGSYLITLRFFCSSASTKFHPHILLLLCAAVTISFSQQGLMGNCKLFQNRFCLFLGAISLPTYLVQNIVRQIIETRMAFLPHRQQVVLIVLFTVGLGAVSYWTVSFLQRQKAKLLHA